MDATPAPGPFTRIRWLAVVAFLIVFLVFIAVVPTGSRLSATGFTILTTLLIALATYAWLIYPPTGGFLVAVSAAGVLLWAWAVRQDAAMGWDLAALVVLAGATIAHEQRWARRLQRIEQTVADVREERTINDQAIEAATHTREALQKKLSRYMQLQAIAEALSGLTDLGSIAELAVDRAFALIGRSDVCLLFLVDKEQQALRLFASRRRESIAPVRAKHGDQFDRHVLRSHRPLLVNDVRRDFRFTVNPSSDRPVSSVVACPLSVGESPEGVLRLDSAQPGVYSQDDLRFLDILLDLLSTAVTNAKLFAQAEQLAVTDGLTGLTLRRPFLEQLSRELIRAGRKHEPVSLLMLDVDRFKEFNDTFGHTAGDLVLKTVAKGLRAVVPAGGVVVRYGGEEFTVLLPRMPRVQAAEVAEQVRQYVEQEVETGSRRARQPVTVSIGVAIFPDDAQSELELIRVADQRLYQAKRSGRNLVCAS